MQTTEAVMEQPSTGIIRAIRMLWTLYVKDVRQLAGICLSLIALSIVWTAIVILTDTRPFGVSLSPHYIFPTILAYYLYANRHSGSVYLQHSLPVSPGASMLSLLTALMTYIVLHNFCIAVIDACEMTYRSMQALDRLPAQYVAHIDRTVWTFIRWSTRSLLRHTDVFFGSSLMHYFNGIVCLAAGIVRPAAGRLQIRYWAGFLGVILLILGVFALLERFEVQWRSVFGQFSYLLVGVVFATIGALLYNRYAEV